MLTRDGQTPTFESSARTMGVRLKKSWEYPPAPTTCQGPPRRAGTHPTEARGCGAKVYRHSMCFGCFSDWAADVERRNADLDVLRQLDLDPVVVNPTLAAAAGVLARHFEAGDINAAQYADDLETLYHAAAVTTHETVVEAILIDAQHLEAA